MPSNTRIKPYDQRLAHFILAPLKKLPLHPNHFTFLTLLLGQLAAWLFAFAMMDFAWLAALCYMLAVFSDHMDGEFARMTGKITKFGHDFDFIVGGINYTTLFIGIGIGLAEFYGPWARILGIVAGLCNPFVLFLRMDMERKFGTDAIEHPSLTVIDLEDFIYLIGPITWTVGIIWFFIPYALGNIGYLIWTALKYHSYRHKELADKGIHH